MDDVAARLRDIHGVHVEVLTVDLTTEQGVQRVTDRLRDDHTPVDLLVNNAGIGTVARYPTCHIDAKQAVRLNVVAVLRLSRLAAGYMRRRGTGTILNMASLAAYAPIPYYATYSASKAFVLARIGGILGGPPQSNADTSPSGPPPNKKSTEATTASARWSAWHGGGLPLLARSRRNRVAVGPDCVGAV